VPSLIYRIVEKVAGLFGYSLPSFKDNPDVEQAAITAAREWLGLIDEGKYGESWRQLAPQFRESKQKDRWIQETRDARSPLGPVHSRELSLSKYAESLPGAPVEGECVIMRFDTQFENKENAVEYVTFVNLGNWYSLASYHIK